MFWGDKRMGRSAIRRRRRFQLRLWFWRHAAGAAVAAVVFGLSAAGTVTAWAETVPEYDKAYPTSLAPPANTPSPKGTFAPAEMFLQSAEALYDATAAGNVVESRLYVRQTEQVLRALSMRHVASAEGIEALAQSVVRMKRSVAAISPDIDKWKAGAAEIRLAADALAHPDKPLWHRYRTVLKEDVLSLGTSLSKSGVSAGSRADLARLKGHYELIRTSVLLYSESYRTERADSVLRYAGRLLATPNTDPDLLSRLIPSLQESMDELFPPRGKDKAAFVPPMAGPPWGWSAFMGTFILSVLTWVGWRRYQGIDRVIPRGSPPPEHRERH